MVSPLALSSNEMRAFHTASQAVIDKGCLPKRSRAFGGASSLRLRAISSKTIVWTVRSWSSRKVGVSVSNTEWAPFHLSHMGHIVCCALDKRCSLGQDSKVYDSRASQKLARPFCHHRFQEVKAYTNLEDFPLGREHHTDTWAHGICSTMPSCPGSGATVSVSGRNGSSYRMSW